MFNIWRFNSVAYPINVSTPLGGALFRPIVNQCFLPDYLARVDGQEIGVSCVFLNFLWLFHATLNPPSHSFTMIELAQTQVKYDIGAAWYCTAQTEM